MRIWVTLFLVHSWYLSFNPYYKVLFLNSNLHQKLDVIPTNHLLACLIAFAIIYPPVCWAFDLLKWWESRSQKKKENGSPST